MVSEQTLDAALDFIRATTPLSRCGVQDVFGDEDAVDVRLGLPTPASEGVHDLYEDCKQTARAHTGDGYRLEPQGTHHIDEHGDPSTFFAALSMEPAASVEQSIGIVAGPV